MIKSWAFIFRGRGGGADGKKVKNLPANAGDTRDVGSIPGSKRSPVKEMATHSSTLAWKIPRTDESGRLQSKDFQRVGHN